MKNVKIPCENYQLYSTYVCHTCTCTCTYWYNWLINTSHHHTCSHHSDQAEFRDEVLFLIKGTRVALFVVATEIV